MTAPTPREVIALTAASEHGCDVEWCDGAARLGDAVLAALAAAGFVVVPQEPDDEQWREICLRAFAHPDSLWSDQARGFWREVARAAAQEPDDAR